MQNTNIIVIGGYGHVGRMICEELARYFPGKVIAAGRNLKRAEAFSRETQGRVRPLQIDIHHASATQLLTGAKLVIMCLDQEQPTFVRACIQQGIHYVDISANYRFLSQIERLDPLAVSNHATAILSVGLAPGLTNLLASHAQQLLDSTDAVHISIMLGLGDTHGKAAIEWTLDNLQNDFHTDEHGEEVQHISFTDGRQTSFGDRLGTRTAYRFNFADQHILPRTLQVPNVATRLCFDSAITTWLLAMFKRLGIFQLLRVPWLRRQAMKAFATVNVGKPLFAVKIDAVGMKQQQPAVAECFLQGTHEAEVTAKVAAIVAKKLYSQDMPPGVYHIEELCSYEDFNEALREVVQMSSQLEKFR